jgi:L-iditol 2-dehydrogenase
LQALVKVKKGVGNIELRDVPEPYPEQEQVKIRVKWAGICGTDVHIYRDEYPYNPPVVLGHEFSGEVTECGKNVKTCKLGDRVSARTFMITCGHCSYCHQGRDNLCLERQSIGSGVNGAFTKYVIVPEKNIFMLPENTNYQEGALSEPIACCVHAVLERTRISPGEKVLVIGPGPIGLISSQLAKISGAHVFIMGTKQDQDRLVLAKKFGADEFIFHEQLKEFQEKNHDWNFDVILECSGSEGGINAGISLIRKGGKYTQLGLVGNTIKFPVDQMVYKEIEFTGSFSHTWSAWEKTMRLLADQSINPKDLISHKLSMKDWEKGFELMEKKEGIKILLKPE